jgi:hypothetical protein
MTLTLVEMVDTTITCVASGLAWYYYSRWRGLSHRINESRNRCHALQHVEFKRQDSYGNLVKSINRILRCVYTHGHDGPHLARHEEDDFFWKQKIDLEKIDNAIEHILPKGK